MVLVACGLVGWFLISTAPQAERRSPEPSVPLVETIIAQTQTYPIVLRSQGTVSPRTQSTLVSEVSGKVITVDAALRSGGFFEDGQVLLRIDPRNYENAVTIAQSELTQAKLSLEEEKARAQQARQDWERLKLSGEPDALATREPQLANASATVAAAEARLRQAQIDLARTEIKAPYAGRVLEKNVDLGQYVTLGSALATIYAVDYVEIRLPVSNNQLEFIQLPEIYRGNTQAFSEIPVAIQGQIGTRIHTWEGKIVRAEGAIDAGSRQWFVVAQVEDPYGRRGDKPPLKVGQFVIAEIQGKLLQDVYRLPRTALQPDQQVVQVSAERTIHPKPVEILWEATDEIVVRGLNQGDEIAVTKISLPVEGMRVRVANDEPLADSNSFHEGQSSDEGNRATGKETE